MERFFFETDVSDEAKERAEQALKEIGDAKMPQGEKDPTRVQAGLKACVFELSLSLTLALTLVLPSFSLCVFFLPIFLARFAHSHLPPPCYLIPLAQP